jgi:hypothetical protein
MALFLDRIDAAPIANSDFDAQFLQWLWVLVDALNENINDIQNALNYLTAPNLAIRTETVTLTSGSPSFTVANGALYHVGDNVIGNGIPTATNILTIVGNSITLDANATINGASALTFIPTQGAAVGNGILLYDTTTNVYVGMQNGALVKFTTTAYP